MEHLSHIFTFFSKLINLEYLPDLGNKVSLGLIFLFGLLTSFHCIAMCGGLVITNSINKKGISPNIIYNCGRIASYSIIGGIAGGIGKVVSPNGLWKGIIPLLGGIFMILLAVKLLNVFPALRKFNLRLPTFIAKRIFAGKFKSHLVIGLLSGLMPCGPLQMVQLYALGTGSILIGAASSFVFALGTVPLLLTFGYINSVLYKKHAKIISAISAAVVLVLGFAMLSRGLALYGVDVSLTSFNKSTYTQNKSKATQNVSYKETVQVIESEIKADEYPIIIVKKGVKVKWNLKATEENLNYCNNEIAIPDFKIEKKLSPGNNIIEFTPVETGDIVYTCWMGMIKGRIKVID